MPDIRLRPAGLPGDIALVPGEHPSVDIRLGAGIAPDVSLGAGLRHVDDAVAAGGDRTGTGTLSLSASFAATGAKAGKGTGSLASTYTEALAGRKGGLGTGTVAVSAAFTQAGTKSGLGTGALTLAPSFASTGVRQEGAETHDGTGTLDLSYAMSASGVSSEAPVETFTGWTPVTVVQHPAHYIRREGAGDPIRLRPVLTATGTKSYEADDELVLALAA